MQTTTSFIIYCLFFKEIDSRKPNKRMQFILLSLQLVLASEFDFLSSLLKNRTLKLY